MAKYNVLYGAGGFFYIICINYICDVTLEAL